MEVLTEGDPDGHLFDFNCTDFLDQFRISRKRLGLDDWVPYQMRHTEVSIDRPEQQIPEASRRLGNEDGGGNICPWHATKNM